MNADRRYLKKAEWKMQLISTAAKAKSKPSRDLYIVTEANLHSHKRPTLLTVTPTVIDPTGIVLDHNILTILPFLDTTMDMVVF